MTPQQLKQHIEDHLEQLGWSRSQVTGEAAELICQAVNGNEYHIDQLCSNLVSLVGEPRNVTKAAVKLAIRELDTVDRASHQSGTKTPRQPTPPDRPTDKDMLSIEQLAAELERKMLSASTATPVASTEAPKAGQIQTAQPQKGEESGKPKILIVDDSPTVRTVINTALENDFACVQAKDGEAAWDMLLTDPHIAVAVVDLEMPALDGYGLIRRIRTAHMARIATTPIIVVTGTADTIAKKEAYLAGADDFMSKTSDPLDLLVRVRTHFRLAQTRSVLEQERRSARSNTATTSGKVEVPTLNHQVSRASRRSGVRGGHKAGENASSRPVLDNVDEPSVSLSAGLARENEVRASPIVKMTLVATALVILVIGFIKYQNRVDQIQTAEDVNTVATQQGTPDQQLPSAQDQSTDTSVQTGQADLPKEEASADEESSSNATDQLSDVPDVTQAIIAAWQSYPSNAPEQQETQPSALIDAKAPPATSQGAAPLAAKEPHQRSTAPAKEAARAPTPRSSSPQSTVDRSTRQTSAPAEAPVRPREKKPTTSDQPKRSRNVAAYTGAAASLDTAKSAQAATQFERPSFSTTSARIGTSNTSVDGTLQDLSPRPITRAEVKAMLQRFVTDYEAGDLNRFMNLFSEQAHTNERVGRNEIRQDYLRLFRNTDTRRMRLHDVTLNLDNNQAQGIANFNVKVQRKGESEVRIYTGSLSFSIERQGQALRIARLYHYQNRADAEK